MNKGSISTIILAIAGVTALIGVIGGYLYPQQKDSPRQEDSPRQDKVGAFTLVVPQGGTGATSFSKYPIVGAGGTGALSASNTPWVVSIHATSTTATSTIMGALGIGTSTPAEQLAVANRFYIGGTGTSTIENNLNVLGGLSVGNYCINCGTGGEFVGGTSTVNNLVVTNISTSTFAGGLTIQTDKFVVANTGGNVGIGTTTPYAKLSVAGQVVGEYFTATGTTASSTFQGVVAQNSRVVNGFLQDTFATCSGAANKVVYNASSGKFGCDVDTGGGLQMDWQKELNYGVLNLTPTTTIPIWAKDAIYASSTLTVDGNARFYQATTTQLYATSTIGLNSEYFTDLTGTGLQNTSGALTLNATGDWTGTIDSNNFAGGAIGTGDLLYGGSAGSIAELAIGTYGNVLAVVNGIPGWVATTTFSTGLTYSAGSVTLDATGDWTGTIDGNNFAGGAIGTGELLYGSGAGAISELAAGTSGYVLTSGGVGAPSWSTNLNITSLQTATLYVSDTVNQGDLKVSPGVLKVGNTSTTTIQGDLATSTFAGPIARVASGDGKLILHGATTTGELWLNSYGGRIHLASSTPSDSSVLGSVGLTISTTTYFGNNVGIGTSSPGSLFSVGGIANFTGATSTFYGTGGLNINDGCFAIDGTCLVIGGTVTSVAATVPSIFSISGSPITTAGTLAMTYSGTALPIANGGTNATSYSSNTLIGFNGTSFIATGTPQLTIGYFTATSTTATSTLQAPIASNAADGKLIIHGATTTGELWLNPYGGKVHIATTSPSTLLTSAGVGFSVSTTTYFGGNVGIGTTSPVATLAVDGEFFASSSTGLIASGEGVVKTEPGFSATGVLLKAIGSKPYITAKLGTTNNASSAFLIFDASQNERFRVSAAGNVIMFGTCTSQGVDCATDYAEYYPASEPMAKGEIAAVDPDNAEHIKRSAELYQSTLLGVISTNPGVVLTDFGAHIGKDAPFNPDRPYMALAGRVSVKVNLENGPIVIGDPITSSSEPGVGMKATKAGKIVGYALENFSGVTSENGGKILVFINLSYWMPPTDDNLQMDQSGLLARIVNWFKNVVIYIKELTTDKITTQKLCIGNTCVTEVQLKELLEKNKL